MKKSTGVLLIQLGTPNSPSVWDVAPYLRQFLTDPRVIDIPWLLRMLLVHLIIVPFRSAKSAKIYRELWEHGNGSSPLKTITQELTKQLNEQLGDEDITVHMAMRYQQPSLDSVLREMQVANYDKLIILPLFPHYASSSSGSAIQRSMEIISRWWVIPDIEVISQFYDQPFYIQTLAEQARKHDPSSFDHIIMSYHGLPERQVDKVYDAPTDLCAAHHCEHSVDEQNKFCYKATVYETSRMIAAELGLRQDQYTVSFQSRLDSKWLRPFSDEVIAEMATSGTERLLVFSPAFVADCLETIVEIGSEYQEIFEEHGGEEIVLVESCNTEALWVNGLAQFLRDKTKGTTRNISNTNS